MPHIILEHSNNIKGINFSTFLLELHELLASKLPTKIENCKSRVLIHSQYIIGQGDKNNAFIHIEIKILPGRNQELLKSIAEIILEKLKAFSKPVADSLSLNLSISIQNLSDIYLKSS